MNDNRGPQAKVRWEAREAGEAVVGINCEDPTEGRMMTPY